MLLTSHLCYPYPRHFIERDFFSPYLSFWTRRTRSLQYNYWQQRLYVHCFSLPLMFPLILNNMLWALFWTRTRSSFCADLPKFFISIIRGNIRDCSIVRSQGRSYYTLSKIYGYECAITTTTATAIIATTRAARGIGIYKVGLFLHALILILMRYVDKNTGQNKESDRRI